jgi:hypothetical protein
MELTELDDPLVLAAADRAMQSLTSAYQRVVLQQTSSLSVSIYPAPLTSAREGIRCGNSQRQGTACSRVALTFFRRPTGRG